jgi:hypothetical protein
MGSGSSSERLLVLRKVSMIVHCLLSGGSLTFELRSPPDVAIAQNSTSLAQPSESHPPFLTLTTMQVGRRWARRRETGPKVCSTANELGSLVSSGSEGRILSLEITFEEICG